MRLTLRLSMPYDVIIADSLIGTEIGGMAGSEVIELRRVPLAGKPDAADMVVDSPEDLVCTYMGGDG